jgi:hypothetical protein
MRIRFSRTSGVILKMWTSWYRELISINIPLQSGEQTAFSGPNFFGTSRAGNAEPCRFEANLGRQMLCYLAWLDLGSNKNDKIRQEIDAKPRRIDR